MKLGRKMLLLALFLCCAAVTTASPVSRQQAQRLASSFLFQKGKMLAKDVKFASKKARQGTNEEAAFYVFNVGEEDGFVVVSGDDRAPAILGYVDEGTFDDDNIPENMKAWLQDYESQLTWLKQHPNMAVKAPALDEHSTIQPLLTCTWNQGAPYNNLCPLDNGNRSVTGCVATAMAQVLYYHQYPAQTTATIPAYTTTSKGISVSSIGITTIDWANMLDNYTDSETSTQKVAVAKLMQLCGSAVEMDYTANSSGASSTSVPIALKRYFDYDAATYLAERGDFRAHEWDNLIYNELVNHRPVYYSGMSTGGGHAFVIDGYDKDGFFHVNWGWGGSSNGYFLLSILDPGSNSGIGASTSTDGYSYSQFAVIGAQPNTGIIPQKEIKLTISDISTDASTVTKEDGKFHVGIGISIWNYTEETHTFDIGVGVFDTNGELTYSEHQWSYELANGWGFSNVPHSADIPALPDGVYYITGISRKNGSDTWYTNANSDRYYLTATVSGNTMTLQAPVIDLSGEMQISGTLEVGSTVTTATTIQNNGTFFNGQLFLQIDGTDVGGRYLEVEAGESDVLEMSFTPTSEGAHTVALGYKTSEIVASEWVSVFHEIASKNVNIAAAKSYSLSFSNGVITNAEGNTINDHTANIQVTVANNGTYNYNDVIRTYYLTPADNDFWNVQGSVDTPVEIATSSSKTINIDIPLTTSNRYWFIMVYKTDGAFIPLGDSRCYDNLFDYTVTIPEEQPEPEGDNLDYKSMAITSPHKNTDPYGRSIVGTIDVQNMSHTKTCTSGVRLRLKRWRNDGSGLGDDADELFIPTNIAPDETVSLPFRFDNLEISTQFTSPDYSLGLFYEDGTPISQQFFSFFCYPGVDTYDENGTLTTEAPTETITVDDNVLALDISGITDVTTVVPNSNPNTLYIVGETIPTGLDGCNVVQNGSTPTLTLTDGYGFFTPIDFSAASARFTRQFTVGADGSNGWSTIILPFDVTEVRQGSKQLDWFHSSSDTGKHFWLKTFASDNGNTVYFDFADELAANTPYIIAVPGNTWGETWNLTNRDITFYACNADILANAVTSVSGSNYQWVGSTRTSTVTNCYVLNAQGNSFGLTTGSVEPFRAWFAPQGSMSTQYEQLTIAPNPVVSNIHEGTMPQGMLTNGTMHDLQGRAVGHSAGKGIYILNSKKIVIR